MHLILYSMLTFSYKYIITAIVSLFVCTSALLLLSHDSFVWYVYLVPCVLTYFILAYRANKIKVYKKQLIVERLHKKEILNYKDIQKIEFFKDSFFYEKTIGIRIYFKNKICKKYYIGTLLTSHLPELEQELKQYLK